jgi:hypothetical protein
MSLSSPSIPYILYFRPRGAALPTQAIRLKNREMQDVLCPGTFLKPGRVLDYRYSKSCITGGLALFGGDRECRISQLKASVRRPMQTRENRQSLLLLRYRYWS